MQYSREAPSPSEAFDNCGDSELAAAHPPQLGLLLLSSDGKSLRQQA